MIHILLLTAPDDYEETTTQLVFGPDSPRLSVVIPIVDDNINEPFRENFLANIALSTENPDVMVRPDEANIRILDNDCKFCIGFST